MAKEHILVVDDEEDILELVSFSLARDGFRVSLAETGEKAVSMASALHPDLIVLDLMLPGVDGLEVTRKLKAVPELKTIPIVMLSAKGEEADIVTGLELGADDYVSKPFSPKVLIARVRSVLRRYSTAPGEENDGEVVTAHDIMIHPGRHQVRVRGESVSLTFSEFQILHLIARRPGWVFTRGQIVDEIRGYNYAVTDRSVDVQIVGLRKKLGDCGHYIETVRGVGYRFKE